MATICFLSPAVDYTGRPLTVKIICGILMNSRVLETTDRYAMIDVSLEAYKKQVRFVAVALNPEHMAKRVHRIRPLGVPIIKDCSGSLTPRKW